MGLKEKCSAENKKMKNLAKTELVSGEENSQQLPPDKASPTPQSSACRMITLDSILSSIHASEEDWPKEFLSSVRKRFGRMPR